MEELEVNCEEITLKELEAAVNKVRTIRQQIGVCTI